MIFNGFKLRFYHFYVNFARYIIYCMDKEKLFPDFVFETSWEVCNKVGGIYAVLSTRAKTLQDKLKDHVIFIGPDCWHDETCPFFKVDDALFPEWRKEAFREGLRIKVGRWTVPASLSLFLWTSVHIFLIRTRFTDNFGKIFR